MNLTRTRRLCQIILSGMAMHVLCFCAAAERDFDPATFKAQLRIDGIHYRPARWNTEHITETVNESLNLGGLVYVYYTNVTEEPVELRSWNLNRKGGSWYRIGNRVAWDRFDDDRVRPGQTSVLEINGVSEDFAHGKPFAFGLIMRNWRPGGIVQTTLEQSPIQISLIHVLPDMKTIEVHLRNESDEAGRVESVEIMNFRNKSVEYVTRKLAGRGNCIARVTLSKALNPGKTLIAKAVSRVGETEIAAFGHRRAFADVFPLGTWGIDPDTYALSKEHGLDTFVRGQDLNDAFYTTAVPEYGFRAMIHTGIYPNVDVLRARADEPSVLCWMPQDEPDWHFHPQLVFTSCEITRKYGPTKPIMITLCRNVKFFEYAPLPDIPCHDHYSVTAPSTSKWPFRYGTRLEETAYYTEDLKRASEPKPIWVWSQGINNWDERPKRPVPTVEELTAQLLFNVGRGAKGILWFTFSKNVGEKYPELRTAIKRWNEVLGGIREDLLSSEPAFSGVKTSEKLDATTLVSWRKMYIFVVNTDYEIHDHAYPFTPVKNAYIELTCPEWLSPQAAVCHEVEGDRELGIRRTGNRIRLDLGEVRVGGLIELHGAGSTPENM